MKMHCEYFKHVIKLLMSLLQKIIAKDFNVLMLMGLLI